MVYGSILLKKFDTIFPEAFTANQHQSGQMAWCSQATCHYPRPADLDSNTSFQVVRIQRYCFWHYDIDGPARDCSSCSILVTEPLQPYTKPFNMHFRQSRQKHVLRIKHLTRMRQWISCDQRVTAIYSSSHLVNYSHTTICANRWYSLTYHHCKHYFTI